MCAYRMDRSWVGVGKASFSTACYTAGAVHHHSPAGYFREKRVEEMARDTLTCMCTVVYRLVSCGGR